MRIFKLIFLSLLSTINGFNSRITHIIPQVNIFTKLKLIRHTYYNNYQVRMSSDQFNNNNEKINFLPSFQTDIIINSWIDYINKDEEKKIPNFIKRSIHDLKFFISINRDQNNKVLIVWCPKVKSDNCVAYILAGKVFNKIIYIERIAQNPFYIDLNIRSHNLLIDLEDSIKSIDNIVGFDYEKLHKYDNRYYLSWNLL